jgi:hypothetical protein
MVKPGPDEERCLRRERPPGVISPAEASQVDRVAVVDDTERQARNASILHLPADIRVDRGEAGRGRRIGGKTGHRSTPSQPRPQAFPGAMMTRVLHRYHLQGYALTRVHRDEAAGQSLNR